jgi:replicative DNA helicase
LLTSSSADEYAKIVKEKSILRNILKVSQKIIGDVYEQKETLDILQTIEKRIFDLTQNT